MKLNKIIFHATLITLVTTTVFAMYNDDKQPYAAALPKNTASSSSTSTTINGFPMINLQVNNYNNNVNNVFISMEAPQTPTIIQNLLTDPAKAHLLFEEYIAQHSDHAIRQLFNQLPKGRLKYLFRVVYKSKTKKLIDSIEVPLLAADTEMVTIAYAPKEQHPQLRLYLTFLPLLCPYLTHLFIDNNELTRLPNIVQLPNLTHLFINNNKLTKLPAWIENLPRLKCLWVTNNVVTDNNKVTKSSLNDQSKALLQRLKDRGVSVLD